MYKKYIKRILDFVLSLMAIIILLPVFIIIAVLVRIKLGSPVLFVQERPGKDEKVFKMYKFRTMTDKRDKDGNLLPDAARMTSFGRILRSASLDELPELWNILKGDMSIVGPRPLLVEYLPRYNTYQRQRHDVRPGLSGLAQINGRNGITWEEKFALDVEYVQTISFLLDLKIVFLTFYRVVKREGINAEGETTMNAFLGSGESVNV